MPISIDYKGWKFLFEQLPKPADMESKYDAYVRRTEVVLPVPTPTRLERRTGPYTPQALNDRRIAVHAPAGGDVLEAVVRRLLAADAEVVVSELSSLPTDVAEDTPGTLSQATPDVPQGEYNALVCDLTSATEIRSLHEAFRVVQDHIPLLVKSGRLVVIGRPPSEAESPGQAAVWRGVDGFVRSIAREVGISGVTANRIEVARGAEPRLGGVVEFLASPRSTYVDGQVFSLTMEGPTPPPLPGEGGLLEGKTAVVTGAARGIGRATGIAMAQEGAHVVWLDLPSDNRFGLPGSESLLTALQTKHGGEICLADVSSLENCDALVELVKQLGGVDILVNNAAVVDDAMFFTMREEAWKNVIDVNLNAPQHLTDRLINEGLLRDFGRIVFLSSVAALAGNPGQVNYSTSKAGLIGLAGYYAAQLRERGITSNAVAAGTTETVLLQCAPDWMRDIGVRLNALSQVGQPEDTANLILFLAIGDAQGISGECIRCCGAALQGA